MNEFDIRPAEPEATTGHFQVGGYLIGNWLPTFQRTETERTHSKIRDDIYFSLLSYVNVLLDSCILVVIYAICHQIWLSLFLHTTTQRLLSWGNNSPWKILGMWHIQTDFILKGMNKDRNMSPWVLMGEGTSIPSPYIKPFYIATLYEGLITMTHLNV